jgi:hypothetical protein
MNYIFLVTCNECSIKDYAGIIPRQFEDSNGYVLKLVRHFKTDEDKDIIRNSVQEIIDYADKQTQIYECIKSPEELSRINALVKKYTGQALNAKTDHAKIKQILAGKLMNSDIIDIMKFIKYRNFTPYTMVIFDDIIPISKALETKISNLFIEGRHYNITTLVSSQKYMGVCNTARQNAFFKIFTQEIPFHAFIEENRKQLKDDLGKMKEFARQTF